MDFDWIKEFQGAITLCDVNGKILYMNDKSCRTFEKQGGGDLIGKSLFDCHGKESSEKLKELIQNRTDNAYTIEKYGIKKLIYQSPWYIKGEFKGLIELSLEIPLEMEHFVRDKVL